MSAVRNSLHISSRPDAKENLLAFFPDILGLEAVESSDAMGSPEPIYAFKFSNGASLSVEFTEDALDDQQARRGAWLELRTDDAAGFQHKVLAAGLPRVDHPYRPFFSIH